MPKQHEWSPKETVHAETVKEKSRKLKRGNRQSELTSFLTSSIWIIEFNSEDFVQLWDRVIYNSHIDVLKSLTRQEV